MKVLLFSISVEKKHIGGNAQNQYFQNFQRQRLQNQFAQHFQRQTSQNVFPSDWAAEGIGQLTTSLLHDIQSRAGPMYNILLSPFSVWSILAMLLEGAGGQTEKELEMKLHLPPGTHEEERERVHSRYNDLISLFRARNGPTKFSSLNFVITDKRKTINPAFRNVIRAVYNGQNFEVDTKEKSKYSVMINNWASAASGRRIQKIISPAVLDYLSMIIGNAVYFKSNWKHPFHPSDTFLMPFRDENNSLISQVPMMNQMVVVPYEYNVQLRSQILELPYADGVTSMIVILPEEKVNLLEVISRMKGLGLDRIIPRNMSEENVQISLPKFHVISRIYLNEVLKQDLPSIFSPQHAEFPYLGNDIFVSKILHKGEIENTEEGTAAFAVSSVQFAYKSSPSVFRANRPFVYLINERKTRTVLFAGTFSNPLRGNIKV